MSTPKSLQLPSRLPPLPERRRICKAPSHKNLEKAGTVDFKKHPARKGGTLTSRQCRPEVPVRCAFPGAPNPGICSISRFGKIFSSNFPGTFPEVSSRTPKQTPETATAFSSFLTKIFDFLAIENHWASEWRHGGNKNSQEWAQKQNHAAMRRLW